MRWSCLLVFVVACASGTRPHRLPEPVLALVHANVVDTNGGPTLRDATIIIHAHKIASVDHTAPPVGARVVDVTGAYVIPGLWDMHVHVFSNEAHPDTDLSAWAFPLFVANGVTGVRDMWTDAEDIEVARQWNYRRAAGEVIARSARWSSMVAISIVPRLIGY